MVQLRDYQQLAHDSVLAAWGEKPWFKEGDTFRSVLANLATSAGKTVIAGSLIASVRERGNCLFLADTDELCGQPRRVFAEKFDITSAVEKAGRAASLEADVVVGSVQTLQRDSRLRRFPTNHFSYIFVDEAHRGSDRNKKITDYFATAKVMGMTATAFRAKLADLSDFYDHVAFEMGMFDLINEGYIAPIKVLTLPVNVDISGVHQKAGDYDLEELDTTIGPYYEEICRMIKEHADGRTIICYLPLIKSSKEFVAIARAHNISANHIDGKTFERDVILRDFARGNFQLLSNSSLLTTGWDCLDVETEILTPHGWTGIGGIAKGDVCYGFNLETGAAEVVTVDTYGERAVRPGEQMFEIKSQYSNVRTTEGHTFFVKYRDPGIDGAPSARFMPRTGRELSKSKSAYLYPVSALAEFPGVKLTTDELRFLAWVMTDGYVCKGGSATIYQVKQDMAHHIDGLLRSLGFPFSRREKYAHGYKPARCHVFRVARRYWQHLRKFYSKSLALTLMEMSKDQFSVFWWELTLGDGEQCVGKHPWLWCNNKNLADRIMQLAVLRGYSTSCNERITPNGHRMFRVGVRPKDLMSIGANKTTPTRRRLSEPNECETVWCVENRLGTLITRRKGKVSIIGNCPKCDCLLNLAPTRSAGLFRQKVGRIGRLLPGVVDGLKTREERLAAIAASAKPDALILDLLWQTAKFGLQGPADLIAGDKKELEELQKQLRKGTDAKDLQEVTSEVQEMRESALKSALESVKNRIGQAVNLVAALLHVKKVINYEPVMSWESLEITPGQRLAMTKQGIDPDSAKDRGHASTLLDVLIKRRKDGLAPFRVVDQLEKAGYENAARCPADRAYDILGGEYLCSFGKHSGRPLRSIPVNYWQWFMDPSRSWFKSQFPIEHKWAIHVLHPELECTCISKSLVAPNCPLHKVIEPAKVASHDATDDDDLMF